MSHKNLKSFIVIFILSLFILNSYVFAETSGDILKKCEAAAHEIKSITFSARDEMFLKNLMFFVKAPWNSDRPCEGMLSSALSPRDGVCRNLGKMNAEDKNKCLSFLKEAASGQEKKIGEVEAKKRNEASNLRVDDTKHSKVRTSVKQPLEEISTGQKK